MKHSFKKNILAAISILFMAIAPVSKSNAFDNESIFLPLYEPPVREYEAINIDDLENKKIDALSEKSPDLMYRIGMMYLEGVDVDRDFIQAREWFQKASNLGNSSAMVELARLFTYGKKVTGFDSSSSRAKKWIKQAEKSKLAKVYYELGIWNEEGIIFPKDQEVAFKYFYKASEMGHYNAQIKVLTAYYFGKGIESSLKMTIEYLRKVRKAAGYEEIKEYTKRILGQIYFDLALSQANPEIRFNLFNFAWDHGFLTSSDAIADAYLNGEGTRKNYFKAEEWYEKSIKLYKSVYAYEKLGNMYLNAPGDIEKDYKKAMNYFQKGAELGGVHAAYFIGHMYYYGLGVEKDPKQAKVWFGRAKKLAKKSESNYFGKSYENDLLDKMLKNSGTLDSQQ